MPATQLAVPHVPGQSFQPSGSAPSRRVGSWATQIPPQPSSVAPSHGRRPSCGLSCSAAALRSVGTAFGRQDAVAQAIG